MTVKKKMTLKDFLSPEEAASINAAIAEAEKKTTGEIKVLVVGQSSRFGFSRERSRLAMALKRAKKEYFELGLDKTRNNTGILLMISLKERIVIVKGSEAVDGQIDQHLWNLVRDHVVLGIRNGKNADGIISAIQTMGMILSEYFPIKPDDKDEISNEIVFKE